MAQPTSERSKGILVKTPSSHFRPNKWRDHHETLSVVQTHLGVITQIWLTELLH
jgi:hypothetical protein